MTYTILTTHTLGGEIEIGFHRKADGTAYAFADLADKNAQLIAQAEANAPKVEFTEDVTASGKEMTITAAAKTLGIGPKKLFDWLRQHKFLYSQSTQAMQTAITRGLMVVRFADITRTDGSKEKKAHAHVTGKGLFYFYQALRKEGLIDRNPILELAA
jgi:anti-repressor protein